MQRRYGKKNRKLTGMLAVLLAMGLAAAVAFPMSARAEAFDQGKKCDVTLTLPEEYVDKDDSLELAIDVYLVASAVPTDGYDSYSLKVEKDFESLSESLGKLVDKDDKSVSAADFAQLAIKQVRDKAPTASVKGELGKKIENLKPGMYLMLARGADITDASKQFDTVKDEKGAEKVVTVANSGKYKYSFLPLLVTLPTKSGAVTNGVLDPDKMVMTSDDGDWVYSLSAELKPSREPNRTYFTITKELPRYELRQTTVFVFKVNYKETDGSTVSIVEQLVFSKGERIKTLRFDNIPVGTDVTVTELYSGANYTPEVLPGQTKNADGTVTDTSLKNIQIPADEKTVNNVTFKNDYDDTDKGGGSVENTFTFVIEKDSSGKETGRKWALTRTYSQPDAEKQGGQTK